jgi:hypothetical protein
MRQEKLVAICALGAAVVMGTTPALAADDAGFWLSVKRGHVVGSSSGTLHITATGIDYDTRNKTGTRRWTYGDIQQLRILSPTRITVLTYEDQGWVKLGADRTFAFELRDGAINPGMVGFILAHTDRTVVTAVLPPRSKTPLFRLLVKHARPGRGSDGVLLMYDDALVYETERATDTRYWRFTDLFAVLPLDRDRLEVLAYEGGAGDLRPFTFQLKSELPDTFARALWAHVNPPAPFVRPAMTDIRASHDLGRER